MSSTVFPSRVLRTLADTLVRNTDSQVTSQLGDVLDLQYPGLFGDVINALGPIRIFGD